MSDPVPASPDFAGLADDLDAAWNAPKVTVRARQHLLRALVADIIADVDEATREVILTIHWRGGQHSQLRVRKPKSGEHGCRTPEEALAVMRSMATRWSDEDVRVAEPNGYAHGPRKDLDGPPCRLAAAGARHPRLPIRRDRIRRLIKDGVLSSGQVVPDAPHRIRASDLRKERAIAAIARTGRPCRVDHENQLPMFPDT